MGFDKDLTGCPILSVCQNAKWKWDVGKNHIWYSSKFRDLLGYNNNELGSTLEEWLSLIHEKDELLFINFLYGLKDKKDGQFDFSFRMRAYSGNYLWVRCLAEITASNSDGSVSEITGIIQDIDQIKKSEEYVHDINLRFRKLIDYFDGGIILENENGTIIFLNTRFCKIFDLSYSTYDILDTELISLFNELKKVFADPDGFISFAVDAQKEGVNKFGEQITLKNGAILECDYIPVFDDKEYKGNLWLFKDITRFKKNEKILKFRLDFEEILSAISTRFINADWENIDNDIMYALEQVGAFIKADRCYTYEFIKDKTYVHVTHKWLNNKKGRQSDLIENSPVAAFPWMNKRIIKNQFFIGKVDDMPDEAFIEKKVLKQQGVTSLVFVPMSFNNEPIGFLGVDSKRELEFWSEDCVKLLEMTASVITNAIKRRESEEALRKNEAQYRSVVNNVKEVIFQTDAEGLWTFLNPAWTEITGFSLEESIGVNFLNFVHEEDRERNLKLFEPLIQRKKDYCRHEIRYYTKDGGFKWIEVFARLTVDKDDNIIGTSGTLNDITARKFSEEEIRKLIRIVETTPSGIVLSDKDGFIKYVNPGMMKMGKYENAERLIGEKISGYTTDEGKEIMRGGILPTLLSGKDWNGEIPVLNSDGEVFPAEVVCSSIKNEREDVQYLLAVMNDITNRKRAEKEIQKALVSEKELNEMKSKFVSMVSHEFRTPLAAIQSSAELLELYWDKWDEEKRMSLLQKIQKAVDNQIELLNDVTEINRSDSGKVSLKFEEIDVINLIEETIEELKTSYPVHPEINFDKPEKTISIITDKKLFRQIVVNLISNAIKYTHEEKSIYIILKKSKNLLNLTVKDEGIGIPAEDQRNLFQPFTRSKNTGKIKGSGLGLSILKRAVDNLGGSVSFESELKKGTAFYIKLPINK